MDVQKIKRLNYSKGGKYKRTAKQIEAAKKNLIKARLTRSAWTPKANEKRRLTKIRKNIKPKCLFPLGNKFGTLRKNRKISENQKILQSMKMLGRKLHSEESKKELSEKWKKDNPMKIPEIQKKQKAAEIKTRKENRKRIAYNNRRNAALTNPRITENWFLTNTLITPYIEKEICELYKSGISLDNLSKKFNVDRARTIRKILIKNKIKIRKPELTTDTENKIIEMYKNNICFLEISKKLKIGLKTVRKALIKNNIPIRKNTDPVYHKKCKEVKNEETNNNLINPAVTLS